MFIYLGFNDVCVFSQFLYVCLVKPFVIVDLDKYYLNKL